MGALVDNTPLTVEAALGGASVFHGHKICELGEDGDELLVDGHPDDETLLRAVDAYAVAEWGNAEGEITLSDIEGANRAWVAFRPHRDDCDDEVCESCRAGEHDTCFGGADDPAVRGCECEDSDHDWRCTCDEQFAWWLDSKPKADLIANPDSNFHAMTIVRFGW